MPRKKNAVVLGRMDCPAPMCAERVAVYQDRLGYFYTRCPVCLADQRRGPGIQLHVWNNAEWLPGVEPVAPPNLPDVPEVQAEGDVPEVQDSDVPRVQAESAASLEGTEVQAGTGEDDAPRGGGAAAGIVWMVIGAATLGVAALASARG